MMNNSVEQTRSVTMKSDMTVSSGTLMNGTSDAVTDPVTSGIDNEVMVAVKDTDTTVPPPIHGIHCNSTSLCETLGSVRYILNDKTGTITRNELVLRELWCYSTHISIQSRNPDTYQYSPSIIHPDFDTSKNSSQFELFQRCILLCNSCFILSNTIKSDNPDETALLMGCIQLGSCVLHRDDQKVIVRVCDKEEEEWEVLQLNPFTSERKRMSIVVKNVKNGSIFVFLKEGFIIFIHV